VGRTVSACSQITVQRPIGDVYRYLRDLGNAPTYSRLLAGAEPLGGGVWRCRARLPLTGISTWDVRLTADEEDRRIAWCALEGADLPSALVVRLTEAEEGTEIHADAWLAPPAHPMVTAALRAAERSRPLRRAGLTPSQLLQQELRRLRQVLETGETATTRGQSSGRARDAARRAREERPAGWLEPAPAAGSGRDEVRHAAGGRVRDEGAL
jgi:uncharacterized membrane protein